MKVSTERQIINIVKEDFYLLVVVHSKHSVVVAETVFLSSSIHHKTIHLRKTHSYSSQSGASNSPES